MADLELTPERNRIYRITHIRNVPWILEHGLHCRSSTTIDPNFVSIGLADLIAKRETHPVNAGPGGVLGDYVPFYFTPHSKMLYNIKTGYGNVAKRPNSDIAILVSSLDRFDACGVKYVYTTAHAYMQEAEWYTDRSGLSKIDWALLRSRDFKNDPFNDPGKSGRYQAETLAHLHVPVEALIGIACSCQSSTDLVQSHAAKLGSTVTVRTTPELYF